MRLDKLVSHGAGVSRKQAADAIKNGRVRVDGSAVTEPAQKCAENSIVTLDGQPLETGHRHYMLNKPCGVLCATSDRHDPTVLELLPVNLRAGVFPAGRLDKDTEGFVLLTTDGALAHRLLSPKSKVGKTYRAVLSAPFELAALQAEFARPIDLGGGDVTSPATLKLLEDGEQPSVELIIYEGRYHQVKRMFERYSLRVLSLRRVAIGGLWLDEDLPPGGYRRLSPKEPELMLTAEKLRSDC